MRHLYNSRVEVLRLTAEMSHGTPTMSYVKISAIPDVLLGAAGELMCRLDLTFVRPGKDQPMPVVAGRAPDRVGLAFYDTTNVVKAGDLLKCVAGPIVGTFEIRVIPDVAVDFSAGHHMEVQVVETAQALVGVFPGAGPEEEEEEP